MADSARFSELHAHVAEARRRLAREVTGLESSITLLFVALAARGHALIEGVPGVGKTTLAKSFASVTGLSFGRIQLTPDMMPSDIMGHSFYDQQSQTFKMRKGPIFTQVLLADELNRTPPRTQSALLEVMQEGQVTIEGRTYPVPQPFFVVATKNPIETEGVYPLPEAERDRFMVHVQVRYPERADEDAFLAGRAEQRRPVEPVKGLVEMLRGSLQQVEMGSDVRSYLLDIVRATREHPLLEFGASPRGAEHLMAAARAHAALEGRWFVVPDDVRDLAPPVLRHRVVPTADAEVEGADVDAIIDEILAQIPAPIAP